MKRGPTIRDVAKHAGVSVSTASLALNGKPGVSSETRARVLKAALELDYHPHAVAKNLADGRTRTIGLINPITIEHLFSSSGFFMRLIQGMHQAAGEYDYSVFLLISETEEEALERMRKALQRRSGDGLVITNPSLASPYLQLLEGRRIPYVFVGRPPRSDALYVDNDNVEIGRLGTQHLIELGHRRIVFLSGPARFTHCQDRLLGYQAALRGAGIEFSEELVWYVEQSEEAVYRTVREKASRHNLSAIFATSGIHAVGAVRALRDMGLSVPEDVAVVCVEDTELTRYFIPPLTAVDLHSYWLGYWAAKLLIRSIEGEDPGRPILIPGELVVRASSGALGKEVRAEAEPAESSGHPGLQGGV